MDLTISKSELSKALFVTESIVERRTTMPILSNVLLSAADGKLKISATDLEVTALATASAKVRSPGSTTVNAKVFSDIVRELPDSEVVLKLGEGERLEIISKGSRLKMIGVSAEEFKQSLQQIGNASMRATHTVNQLLALARAEGSSSAMVREPCDLAELTIAVVQDCLPSAIDKSIDLGYEGALPGADGVTLEGNPVLLAELIRNLLVNAIHYTPSSNEQPGVVTTRVLADPFGKVILLQVEDSGPGIAASEREMVFQPFYRVLGSGVDGSGLGLPIVVEIAHLHRARVSVEDAQAGANPPGTRFSVRFDTDRHADESAR